MPPSCRASASRDVRAARDHRGWRPLGTTSRCAARRAGVNAVDRHDLGQRELSTERSSKARRFRNRVTRKRHELTRRGGRDCRNGRGARAQ